MARRSARTTLVASALLAVVASGCVATQPLRGRPDLLDFVADAHTTERDVLVNLGEPSARFADGTIFTYRIGYDPKQKRYFVVGRQADPSSWPVWVETRYSLVLVFDEHRVLQRHSLVDVQ